MATSQHEGHANQLDLLIRAGNIILYVCDFEAEAGASARAVFVNLDCGASGPLCCCAEVMEGNQEVITLVAICMAFLHD